MDFRFHADDHGCIRVQLGDEPSEDDPVIITGLGTTASWARKLVEQANRPHEPHLWQSTTSVQTLVPGAADELARVELLLENARNVVNRWNDHSEVEDVTDEMGELLERLAYAVKPWDPK